MAAKETPKSVPASPASPASAPAPAPAPARTRKPNPYKDTPDAELRALIQKGNALMREGKAMRADAIKEVTRRAGKAVRAELKGS